MINVTPPPATPNADCVSVGGRLVAAGGTLQQPCGKIRAGVDGKLERTPEAAVHFHEHVAPSGELPLHLDHGDAFPVERLEQPCCGLDEIAPWRDALAIDAYATLRRFLTNASVREGRQDLPVPAQHEDALAGAVDVFLNEQRERGFRRGVEN